MSQKWVRLKKYCEESGEPDRTVMKKLEGGYYRLGIHLKKDPAVNCWWVNTEAVDEWLDKAITRG
ncbi:hypothetical protein NX722_09365 [Endozoicomonas gorgoniicola]|uniref:Excisionase n=1 Tax=Endozoicomonas gorgoniicola TaxID=1234144 RepID=A0ABT3MTX8_9GAMM|nr:hypothetical protein [Endozoicomonas gorgoniicola]MCW7552847.1 hypothetical protein [Endozoicomonas gorgoniicola]